MTFAPATGEDWLGLTSAPLPVADALAWSQVPSTGAQVVFCGTVRDTADGRDDVVALEYEAYHEHVEPRLQLLAEEVRARYPSTTRLVLLHRTGRLELTEVSVLVVVSSPHRAEAFDAARFAIDTLKATLPIWKKELWAGGEDWGTRATPVQEISADS